MGRNVIRENVWETASSAVHSLVVAEDGLEPSKLPVDENNYIITDFGDFGEYNMGITTFDQSEKLSYLATEMYYLNRYDTHIEENYNWQRICEVISDYAGARGVRLMGKVEPSLNHQAIPEYEPKFCNIWDDGSIINFIFNKYVGIKMSHD